MRVLITGVTGFVGRHLLNHLRSVTDWELHGWSRHLVDASSLGIPIDRVDWSLLDSVAQGIRRVQPEAVIHLAGHADAGGSFANPLAAWSGNLTPTLHLYQAVHESGLQPRVLHVSSGSVYGRSLLQEKPVDELCALAPMSPYSASKAAGEMAALQYGHHFPIIRVRPFNHIGAGQSNHFALANFAEQIARIECGAAAPVLQTGNLDVERDIIDVRDMVRAYHALLMHGTPGDVYNAGRGQPVTMRHCVELLLQRARVPIEMQIRAERQRSIDVTKMRVSIEKLRAATNWNPTISLSETIEDVLNDWRQRITTSTF
jgi:GDP-4-dehydro-6-deoxy-D-mannose reductase